MYTDPVIKKYTDLIKDNSGVFKSFYQGDPVRVPASNLPCLIISRDETRISRLANVEDEHAMALILTVITDIRDEIQDEKALVPGLAALYNIIEARDDTTYKLKEDSVLGILRGNQLVDETYNLRTDLDTITSADYGATVGKRQENAWALEGQVRFIAHFTQLR